MPHALMTTLRGRAVDIVGAVLVAAFAMALVLAPTPEPALATNYEQVVDITFPVDGDAYYPDTFDACRSGCSRIHQASDIMVAYGTPVHAAVGGTITWITGLSSNPPSYGYMISIRGDDGREYNYVHLGRQDRPASEAYAPGLRDGSRVERGQLLGWAGCSGNASCSAPHLHFEIEDPSVTNPYGGTRINPYFSLRAAEDRGDLPGAVGLPLTGDWDGDGRDDVGYWLNGRVELVRQDGGRVTYSYGSAGDEPIVGDWNGDGIDTLGVVRGNRWLLRNAHSDGPADIDFRYGKSSDHAIVGDWDGDGVDTPGVIRGNRWFLTNVLTGGYSAYDFRYGYAWDDFRTGDWDGDGDDTPAVVRGNRWLLTNGMTGGFASHDYRFGTSSDQTVSGDWNGDGKDTPGVLRNRTWYLSSQAGMHMADIVIEG